MLARHVYVHVPFCTRRCAYCDFSIAVRSEVPVDDYVSAVRAELRLRYPGGTSWEVETIYLGGGTPSRLGADGVARLLDALCERLALAASAEVTLEANPEDVSREAASRWRAAGVNRVSLGIQSFDDRVLAWMRRTHNASQGCGAVDAVRAAGIDNLSVDLIFALPDFLDRRWEADLSRVLDVRPEHVSLYGLTIEHHTPLGRWVSRGAVAEPGEAVYESEFLDAHAAMAAAGFDHYEVSNFAQRGHRSRHNSTYWSGAGYAGLGPSAHEFDGRVRRWNVSPYEEWRRRLCAGFDPEGGREVLTDTNRRTETVYLGLRTTSGLRLTDEELEIVRPWVEAGWGTISAEGCLVLSPRGWLRLDALASVLTAARSP